MSQVALDMTEAEFIALLEETVKPADSSGKIVPLEGITNTRSTSVKTVTFGVVSSMEKREALYDALAAFARADYKVIDYAGWRLNVEDKTFTTVIHSVVAKLVKKGC